MKIQKFNENIKDTEKPKVFIEPVASASDFYQYLDINEDYFDFPKSDFHDDMTEFLWSEGVLSSRYDKKWCQTVIDGGGGEYWDKVRKYYPAILKFMEDYNLETIRFAMDW